MEQYLPYLLVAGFIAIVIQAYSMGWQAGHDVHHNDTLHGRDETPPKPPSDTPLWR